MMNVPQSVLGELLYMIAPDGEIFEFTLDNAPKAYANLGTVAYSFVTSKAYQQDGTTWVDQFAEERIMTIDYQEICDTRQQWWDRRRELQAFFRPNRGGVYSLVLQQPEKSFSLRVVPDPGLEFAGSDISSLTILETIRFRAFDPFWVENDLDPTVFVEVVAEDLIFPITFPITFGSSGTYYRTGDLNYAGTVKSYPIITLTGPYASATIRLLPQNKIIRLSAAVPTLFRRIIDPNPANPSITDDAGNSHFDELDLESDPLQDFCILPEPPGEDQEIEVIILGGTTGETAVAVQFETRYIGI